MISSEIETITPNKAKQLITSAENPRGREDPRTIAAYARVMKASGWKVAEAILIDSDGRLLDGFTRLKALIEADVPVRFLVTRGLERSVCIGVINGGKRRPPEAVLRGAGKVDANAKWYKEVLSSLLRLPHAYSRMVILNCDYPVLFDLYKADLDFAAEGFGMNSRGLCQCPVIVAFTRANHCHPTRRVDLLGAISRYKSLAFEIEGDQALRLLAAQVSNAPKPDRADLYLRAANAVHAFLKGTPMGQLKRASKDPFPIEVPW